MLAQRDQLAPHVELVVGRGVADRSRARFELEDVRRVAAQREAGVRLGVELEAVPERAQQVELEKTQRPRDARALGQLREAATIAGKDLGIRIAARGETQQQFV